MRTGCTAWQGPRKLTLLLSVAAALGLAACDSPARRVPDFYVAIAGPTAVRDLEPIRLMAAVAGASPPWEYEWVVETKKGGTISGSGSEVTYHPPAISYGEYRGIRISCTVTAADGAQAKAEQFIQIINRSR